MPAEDKEDISIKILLKVNVTNHGLADQVHDDILLKIHNNKFNLLKSNDNSLYTSSRPQSLVQMSSDDDQFSQNYYINGLKAHSSLIIEIPVYLSKRLHADFRGPLESTFTYNEFTTSVKPKHQVIVFD